jgi:hypothetical protein
MPEYYLHLLEQSGEILVTDSDGITLSDAAEARREAIGLARDIVGHGLHKPTWQVVVTDVNAGVVFAVPLSGIHPHKMKAMLALARRISTYEPKLRSHIFTLLLTAAMCVMIVQATLLIQYIAGKGRTLPGRCDSSLPGEWNGRVSSVGRRSSTRFTSDTILFLAAWCGQKRGVNKEPLTARPSWCADAKASTRRLANGEWLQD